MNNVSAQISFWTGFIPMIMGWIVEIDYRAWIYNKLYMDEVKQKKGPKNPGI